MKKSIPLWLALLAMPVLADDGAPGADAASVLELMRLETQQALAHARDRQGVVRAPGPAHSASPSAADAASGAQLLAIAGVGERLVADVVFRAQRYRYRSGHAWPVGADAGSGAPRLLALDTQCLVLEGDSGGAQARLPLCLIPALAGVR